MPLRSLLRPWTADLNSLRTLLVATSGLAAFLGFTALNVYTVIGHII